MVSNNILRSVFRLPTHNNNLSTKSLTKGTTMMYSLDKEPALYRMMPQLASDLPTSVKANIFLG